MLFFSRIFDKEWKSDLCVFLISFCIYFYYFHQIFLNLNSLLSSITLDSIKNYYTFAYHIQNDSGLLNFEGMNYPLGEHVVYTDCQPLLGLALKLLPFTHPYLIGILHGLLFFSFIVTPLILHRIFRHLDVNRLVSALFSIGIGLLSPQFLKINGGHHALAYGCFIPISILLNLRFLVLPNNARAAWLFMYNTCVFFIHPYMGFGLSVFTLLILLIYTVANKVRRKNLKNYLYAFGTGLMPVVFFKVFMALTDSHVNRTTEPYGSEVMVENLDSLLSPVFGPFQNMLGALFPDRSQHFEGHSYLGFFTIVLAFSVFALSPFILRKNIVPRSIVLVFFSSLFILFIAFGYHHRLLQLMGLKVAAVNQFRAVCRFAWFFYFALPLFVITILWHYFKNRYGQKGERIMLVVAILFLSSNLFEARDFFRLHEAAYWKFRNVFNTELLNAEETAVLGNLKSSKSQAILPLPIFHGGSEMYDREGSSNSMIPSMIYSYHSGLPILSVMMSRTSMTETEDLIQLLNSYKKDKNLASKIKDGDFLVLKTNDPLFPDESRLLPYLKEIEHNDSLSISYLNKTDLLAKKTGTDKIVIRENNLVDTGTKDIVYIPFENRAPFTTASMDNFETIAEIDSNVIRSGQYIVSLRYYYKEKIYQSLSTNLIVNESGHDKSEWIYNITMRKLSGFYRGYGIFEQFVMLKKNKKYHFLLKGLDGRNYRISHFMLRPSNIDVLSVTEKNDTIYNNFPEK